MAAKKAGGQPAREQRPDDDIDFQPRVVVKFRDGVRLPYSDDVGSILDERGVGPWRALTVRYPGIRIRRLINALEPERIQALVEQAIRRDREYKAPDFLTYFVVDCPPGVDAESVAKELTTWNMVERAYVDRPGRDPVVNPGDDPRSGSQGYLDPAPDGIDAEFAWGFTGGDGAGQSVIDLEQGWTLDHEDLAAHGATLLFGSLVNGSRPHGTSVLGEICAVDNALGCVGITPNLASVNVVSHSGMTNTIPNAIFAAVATLPFGGVLLLEVQLDFLPAETLPANFDAIRLATALGITVVEAAGNGGDNLDLFTDGGLPILNRASASFRDSGAIMVGAATSTVPHGRDPDSNFGSRIDCYAWGDSVESSTSNAAGSTTMYTSTFSNTSAASPIVTGAALAVQGIAEANLGFRFSPRQLRAILANPATGTASGNPAVDRIGVMPNLRAIIEGDVIGLAPDVYVRDFVGDTGDPHVGAISASPDVIARPVAEADPQAAFGEGSGTENSGTLGFVVEAGQDNFLYVRARNRGGSDAANVTATVFWSPVSTLVTPDLWTLVGSAVLPNVPAGNVLTVSPGITWPAAEIPGEGHYCFVGLIGHAADPAPDLTDLLNWDNFRLFIRANNNVTWRNFNVEDNEPDPSADPEGYVALPFLAPGAPDRARRMALDFVAKLPRGARILLEVPLRWRESLGQDGPFEVDEKGKVLRLPLNPSGRRQLPEMLFPAKSRTPLRLLVHVPKAERANAYEVYARQLFEREEVGRVTWRLQPRRKRPEPVRR